ncbi:MAG TPA: FABP family protein [Jiangellaceae bacterium]|nr:FABP family protein [Jiangellaceae bacterium]
MIEIPSDLHPDCVALAWLLGTWRGAGVGENLGAESYQFGQEAVFGYEPHQPYLTYASATWVLDENGVLQGHDQAETGYWRPQPDGQVEVLLTHPTGVIEIYLGDIESAKIELATRGVLKTETGPDYRAGHRLYGLVNSRLMWVYEVAADGHELQPRMSAELKRDAAATDLTETS